MPPTRPALRERYDRRQRAIVDTAAEVFALRGYHATSMSELTEATGLAAGGLYHYIGSKEQLLIRICEQLMHPVIEEVGAIAARDDAPPERLLREAVRAWMTHVERHRSHMIVFQQERRVIEREPQWSAVRESRKAFERLLDELLARAERGGALRAADRGLALRALLGMVNYTPQWFDPDGRLSAERIADGYCDLIVA